MRGAIRQFGEWGAPCGWDQTATGGKKTMRPLDGVLRPRRSTTVGGSTRKWTAPARTQSADRGAHGGSVIRGGVLSISESGTPSTELLSVGHGPRSVTLISASGSKSKNSTRWNSPSVFFAGTNSLALVSILDGSPLNSAGSPHSAMA